MGDSGPACPHYSGWNGGHHRAKEGMDVLGSLGKDLKAQFGTRAVIFHLLNGSLRPEGLCDLSTEHLSGVKKTKFSWVHFKI